MGLVPVCNPRKLRRLSERVGRPVIRAYSRFYDNQRDLVAFTDAVTAWCVPADQQEPVTRTVEQLELTDKGVRQPGFPR